MAELLKDKNILIMGVSNKWSIAWGITQACFDAGANILLSCQDERTEKTVRELTRNMEGIKIYRCDVTDDEQIKSMFDNIKKDVGVLHGLVHSIAFAKKEELEGAYYNTSRDGYLLAQNVSVYSLVAATRYAKPLMNDGEGSIVTLTYLGSERAIPNYNVMGVAKAALEASVRYLAADLGPDNIRVNSISAGPIKTISARGVKDFTSMLKQYEEKIPLKQPVTQKEIGDTALFLLSSLSRGITGENIHVDGGYHILGI